MKKKLNKKSNKKVVKKPAKKAEPHKKIERQLTMPSPVDANIQVVVASELYDDEMIEKELSGSVMPFFVYRFKQDNSEVVGLTVKGVNEVVRRLNKDPKNGSKIRLNPQYLIKEECEREGEKGIEVSVYAEDLITGNSAWGVKFEPYFKQGRNGRYKNTFAVEKALSKAERNAKRKLISEPMAIKVIDAIIKSEPDKVTQIEAPKQQFISVTAKEPVTSSTEDKKNLIRKAVMYQKNVSVIIEIDEKTTASNEFDAKFKTEIHELAEKRVSELEK